MFIFFILYAAGFLYTLREIYFRRYAALLFFFVFCLPIYITALTTLHQAGGSLLIPLVQYSKEFIVLLTLITLVVHLDAWPKWNVLDKLVIAYFCITTVYVFLPLGGYPLYQKLVALKNISFFPVIYFVGRLVRPETVWISKVQAMIMVLMIAAAGIVLIEVINYQHLQTLTGYVEYYLKYFGQEPTGNHGLSWNFEIEGGVKRFAAFFANPLELAAATLLTVAVLVAMYVKKDIAEPRLFATAILASLICIVFALSRASMAGYFMASYLFFLLNGNRKILRVYHGLFIVTGLVFVYFLANDEIGEFFLKTFTFENTSSLSHLLEWIDGIDAMQNNPLGLGLGESGRVSGELGTNIGGENQLIIIGVQTGVLPMLLYAVMYALVIGWSAQLFRKGEGKEQQVGIVLFILKVGLIIPVLTASVESYLYVSSVGWFLVGLLSSLRTSFVQMHRD